MDGLFDLNMSENKLFPVSESSLLKDQYILDETKVYTEIGCQYNESDSIISDTSEDNVESIEHLHNDETKTFQDNGNVCLYNLCNLENQTNSAISNNTKTFMTESSKINVSKVIKSFDLIKVIIFQIISDVKLPSFKVKKHETSSFDPFEFVDDLSQECSTKENLELVRNTTLNPLS